MSTFTEIRIRRFSAGSILKICLFVAPPGLVLGLLFGLFALWGFNTVSWAGHAVLGFDGLLLGLAISLAAGLFLAVANFFLIVMGMAVVSRLKTTKVAFQE